MIIDIRRALEALCPNAMWDFSIPNEGGEVDAIFDLAVTL